MQRKIKRTGYFTEDELHKIEDICIDKLSDIVGELYVEQSLHDGITNELLLVVYADNKKYIVNFRETVKNYMSLVGGKDKEQLCQYMAHRLLVEIANALWGDKQ